MMQKQAGNSEFFPEKSIVHAVPVNGITNHGMKNGFAVASQLMAATALWLQFTKTVASFGIAIDSEIQFHGRLA